MLNDSFQIDCHAERLEYLMSKAAVDRAVVFPVFHKDYAGPNREIAALTANNKRLIGFARVASGAPDAPRQLEYAIKELGLKGVKLHTTEGFPTRQFMDKVRELRIPCWLIPAWEWRPWSSKGLGAAILRCR